MKLKLPLSHRINNSLDEFRLQTAKPDALIQSSLLGLLVGLLVGGILVVFILIIDYSLGFWLPNNNAENFEALPPISRLIAPIIGSIILAILFKLVAKDDSAVGVVNVLERLRYHQGYLRFRSFILQFIGASIALVSGQSMGREGPAIHLGAYVGSALSQSLGLPNNAIRTLVACGAAAAISAAFNTPLAGVIFAMEIIMVEYTFASFIPIIISAVAATGVSRSFLGNEPLVAFINIPSISLTEIPFVILIGLLVGIVSTSFTTLIGYITKLSQPFNLNIRFILAGSATGMIAVLIPQIMGLGYDTLNQAVLGQIPIVLLLSIMLAKLIATAISVGCGMPAGLIGPSLVIGATCGSLMAIFLHQTMGIPLENTSLYALIGMSAMMGACLQAPLAALTAVFEITANHSVIWPSMLAIVVAQLISRQLFKQPPVFDLLLKVRGLDFQEDPITQSLQRTGIAQAMSRSFALLPHMTNLNHALGALENNPQWICIQDGHVPMAIIRGVDLIQYLEHENNGEDDIDLMKIPAKRLQISSIDLRATLAKARETFIEDTPEALCVTHWNRNAPRYIYGILTREQFEQLYMR
ncbi:MAG: chloride channel protein [Gammaproteobacteria bacterium]